MPKIVSLNIELNKHFERIMPFVLTENPDMFCVQEIFERDVDFLKRELGFTDVVFTPMSLVPYFQVGHPMNGVDIYNLANEISASNTGGEYDLDPVGIAIFSKTVMQNKEDFYYVPMKSGKPVVHDAARRRESEGRVVLFADVDGCRVATTHFTWSAKGLPDEYQYQDVEKMLGVVEEKEVSLLCGDFNAPRGGPIFSIIAKQLKDNIPEECINTLDFTYHKLKGKGLNYVVDGLFSSPKWKVRDVRVVDGVSDHMAIVANVLGGV